MRKNETWRRALPFTVALLVTVGVVASLIRYLLPHALHVTVAEPLYGGYAREQLPILSRHPISEAAHRVGGALLLLLGAAQLLPRLRARPALHRFTGRVFLALSLLAVASAIWMAAAYPFAIGERAPTLVFGALLVAFAVKGFVHARRREIAAHREWMIRCYAVGLGIGTLRLMVALLVNLTSLETRQVFVPAMWAGFSVTLIVAEIWIRRTRSRRAAATPMSPEELDMAGPASA